MDKSTSKLETSNIPEYSGFIFYMYNNRLILWALIDLLVPISAWGVLNVALLIIIRYIYDCLKYLIGIR